MKLKMREGAGAGITVSPKCIQGTPRSVAHSRRAAETPPTCEVMPVGAKSPAVARDRSNWIGAARYAKMKLPRAPARSRRGITYFWQAEWTVCCAADRPAHSHRRSPGSRLAGYLGPEPARPV